MMMAIATSARIDNITTSGPRCHSKSGVALPTPGIRRSRYAATPTPPAAIAPLKPATNDVHPVRNAARLPNASRRYTYSPPASGCRAASSAYASAPANASAPPRTHTPRIAARLGTSVATKPGVMKMPTPMTFEMTIAAASSGPSRRSREVRAGLITGRLVVDQLARNRIFSDAHPTERTILGIQLDARIHEVAVLEEIGCRIAARDAVVGLDRQLCRRRTSRQAF